MQALDIARPATSRLRWTVCALLFFATTINYVDRQVLSLLAETLQRTIGWNKIDYGHITATWTAVYALGLLGAGRMLDRVGTRKGFSIAVTVWSIAAMLHAAATSVFTFAFARGLLGLGESANFPACIKTIAEWFPKKERALATGLFNSGANVGAVVTPLVVPWLALNFGWQSAFIATGSLGFLWLICWLLIYRRPEDHARISDQEFKYIRSDPPDPEVSIPWARLFPKKETWAFSIGKFLTDGMWVFYLFWFPMYLQETFGISLTQVIIPMIVVYNASTVGSIGGGWLSGNLIKRGWSLNASRKTAMLIGALCVLPVLYAPYSKSLWVVVGLISLYAAAHQGWSANLFTTASDMFPRAAVGSVTGIGGTAGALGGVLMQLAAGYIVQWTHSYMLLFFISGSAYLIALGIFQLLSPKLELASVD
jgi:ACS family hexuronate transporter-like MFS transporter